MKAQRQKLAFTKMHGLGNDFVVLDLRDAPDPSPEFCRFLADRQRGVGCDLVLGIAAPRTSGSIAAYRIWTPSGLASLQCGNGARCIAAWAVRAGLATAESFTLDSPSGTHAIDRLDTDRFRVALGVPDFAPPALLLQRFNLAQDEYSLSLEGLPEVRFAAVSIGNPHVVIEVEDITIAPVGTLGPRLRNAQGLLDSVNVGFVQLVTPTHLRLRVDEFGAGETLACASGACAAAAALIRRGRAERDVVVSLAGGDLEVSWPSPTAEIAMTGPATFVFEGTVPTSIIAELAGWSVHPSSQSNVLPDPEIHHE